MIEFLSGPGICHSIYFFRGLTELIKQYVRRGTTIMTDKWRSYSTVVLGRAGFTHHAVNHSRNFVAPDDPSVHTQNIERQWKSLKAEIMKAGNRVININNINTDHTTLSCAFLFLC